MPFDSSEYEFASPQVELPVDPVLANLMAARALLSDEKRWARGGYCVGEGFCALGALGFREGMKWNALRMEARGYLKAALLDGRMVTVFNDDPNTTHADILALFDGAIAIRKAQT